MLSPNTRQLIDRLLQSEEPELVAIGETLEECADTDEEAAQVARQFAAYAEGIAKEISDGV